MIEQSDDLKRKVCQALELVSGVDRFELRALGSDFELEIMSTINVEEYYSTGIGHKRIVTVQNCSIEFDCIKSLSTAGLSSQIIRPVEFKKDGSFLLRITTGRAI